MSAGEGSDDRSAGKRRLPMAGRDASGAQGSGGAHVPAFGPVDPARIRAGWEHRFVAAGARAEEMIDLYRELGFEVAADPVVTGGLVEGCATCFGGGGDEYRSIYTRRPANGPRESDSMTENPR